MKRIRIAFQALIIVAVVAFASGVLPAQASSSYLCQGYAACNAHGFSDAGYQKVNKNEYWLMTGGHNCTNYVAYRMVKNGMSKVRPWKGTGNAYNWGHANAATLDQSAAVGAVAWWKANAKGAGSLGHVAYVERVISATEIVISEDNWGGNFDWRRLKWSSGWPSGFLHFNDARVGSPRGRVDAATSPAAGLLSVRGWAYDPNKMSKAVRIRVYVDGPAGQGKKFRLKSASLSRPDVAKAYPGVGASHGYDQTIAVKETGRVAVYVYALNVGKTPGASVLLGRKMVSIRP